MIRIKRPGEFEEMLEALHGDNLELAETIRKRIRWFQKNSDDTRLNNHPLHKHMEGKWAFSVMDDIRIIYVWEGDTTVRFLAIGRHEEVYKKSS